MSFVRRAPRHSVTLFIGGGPTDDGSLPIPVGRTKDLSCSGIFLLTDARPPIGALRKISLVWGDDIYFARARVIRHADAGIGLSIVDAEPGFVVAVREIVGDEPTLGSAADGEEPA